VILRLAVLIQYTGVSDRQTHTDRQTNDDVNVIYRASIALHGKRSFTWRNPPPPSGAVFRRPSAGTSFDQPVHQIWSLYVYSLRRYERRRGL